MRVFSGTIAKFIPSTATQNTKKSAKGLEENFVFLFAFFAYAKIRFIIGKQEFPPLRKRVWGKPRGVFPKRFFGFDARKIARTFRKAIPMVKLGIRQELSHKPDFEQEKTRGVNSEFSVKVRFVEWGLRIFLRSQKNLAMVAKLEDKSVCLRIICKNVLFLNFYASLQCLRRPRTFF